jgi:hypothetical protein
MRVDEDVRVERDHPLPTLHQLEQLVAVREVDPRQEAAIDRLEPERVGGRPARVGPGQAVAQRLV